MKTIKLEIEMELPDELPVEELLDNLLCRHIDAVGLGEYAYTEIDEKQVRCDTEFTILNREEVIAEAGKKIC